DRSGCAESYLRASQSPGNERIGKRAGCGGVVDDDDGEDAHAGKLREHGRARDNSPPRLLRQLVTGLARTAGAYVLAVTSPDADTRPSRPVTRALVHGGTAPRSPQNGPGTAGAAGRTASARDRPLARPFPIYQYFSRR